MAKLKAKCKTSIERGMSPRCHPQSQHSAKRMPRWHVGCMHALLRFLWTLPRACDLGTTLTPPAQTNLVPPPSLGVYVDVPTRDPKHRYRAFIARLVAKPNKTAAPFPKGDPLLAAVPLGQFRDGLADNPGYLSPSAKATDDRELRLVRQNRLADIVSYSLQLTRPFPRTGRSA